MLTQAVLDLHLVISLTQAVLDLYLVISSLTIWCGSHLSANVSIGAIQLVISL